MNSTCNLCTIANSQPRQEVKYFQLVKDHQNVLKFYEQREKDGGTRESN